MKAIKGGYKEIAQFLLDVGINVKLSNFFGDTALHWAVSIHYQRNVQKWFKIKCTLPTHLKLYLYIFNDIKNYNNYFSY